MINHLSLANLRKQMRQKRSALTPSFKEEASRALCSHVATHPALQAAQHVGVYLALPEEISLMPVIEWLWEHQRQVYIPRLEKDEMTFSALTPKTMLTPNRFGILEPPSSSQSIHPLQLDVVLTPLVAFDSKGARLGMGGGFYDKAFQHKKQVEKPILIGCAFSCQKTDDIPTQSWDIFLEDVLTEKGRLSQL